MLGMVGVGPGVEHLIEPWDAAAVFRRAVPFAGDIARVGYSGQARADVGDGDLMLPAVAEVVDVVDDRLAGLQHLAQADLGRFLARLGSPVLVHG